VGESTACEEEIERSARQAAERSARDQGLPTKISDPVVMEQVAAIVQPADRGKAA